MKKNLETMRSIIIIINIIILRLLQLTFHPTNQPTTIKMEQHV